MPFGVIVDGPNNFHFWEATASAAEVKLAGYIALAKSVDATSALSRDDFTITEVFAKAWDGPLDTTPNAPDWDTCFAAQTIKDATDAITTLGLLEATNGTSGNQA